MSFWLTQAALRAYSALRSISSSPTLKYYTVLKRGQTQMEPVQAHVTMLDDEYTYVCVV